MPQPEAPAARSGAIQGSAYSESAFQRRLNDDTGPLPISQTRILHQPVSPCPVLIADDLSELNNDPYFRLHRLLSYAW